MYFLKLKSKMNYATLVAEKSSQFILSTFFAFLPHFQELQFDGILMWYFPPAQLSLW